MQPPENGEALSQGTAAQMSSMFDVPRKVALLWRHKFAFLERWREAQSMNAHSAQPEVVVATCVQQYTTDETRTEYGSAPQPVQTYAADTLPSRLPRRNGSGEAARASTVQRQSFPRQKGAEEVRGSTEPVAWYPEEPAAEQSVLSRFPTTALPTREDVAQATDAAASFRLFDANAPVWPELPSPPWAQVLAGQASEWRERKRLERLDAEQRG